VEILAAVVAIPAVIQAVTREAIPVAVVIIHRKRRRRAAR